MREVEGVALLDARRVLLVAQGERPFRVGECVEGSGKVVYSDER